VTGHRRRLLPPVLLMLAVLALIDGCSSAGEPTPAATSAAGRRHDPSPAELAQLRRQLAGIKGVQKISEFTYKPGTFGNGPATDGTFDTAATSRPELVSILEDAYRLTWYRSDIAMGTLIYVVRNPATGAEAGASDLGFDTASIGPRELQQRYGPAPTPSPSP